MANAPRKRADSGVYHVVVRGNGRQVIFYDDADRRAFLSMLARCLKAGGASLWAWCLMDNHVHLLVEDPDGSLSKVMQNLLTGYARYFNGKTGHVGHVFQQRFFSEPVESERQLLATVRYIHINPEKDGIKPVADYRWSSYQEYVGGRLITSGSLCDAGPVLELVDGSEGFIALCSSCLPYEVGFEGVLRLTDDEARLRADVIARGRGLADAAAVRELPRAERDDIVRQMKGNGMSINQIERLTGVGRGAIARIH